MSGLRGVTRMFIPHQKHIKQRRNQRIAGKRGFVKICFIFV